MMLSAILLGWVGPTELIIIGVILLIFFGGKKIPEMMRGLGKGVKSFKEGINEDDKTPPSAPKSEEKPNN